MQHSLELLHSDWSPVCYKLLRQSGAVIVDQERGCTLCTVFVSVFVGDKWTVCMRLTVKIDGSYANTQIYQPHLEWELKSVQTTQVSKCHGSGHVTVCLILLEGTINGKEALGWCTQLTIQQQPVPPCPTSSVTQSTLSGFMLRVD